jgi:hypothetical protein
MLEIGINTGSSLRLWKEFFPFAFIHGADIGFSDEGDRYKVHKVDQSKVEDLLSLSAEVQEAFFIIDDGSHIPEHQLLTLDVLFVKTLIPGGIYIIEDIEVSYWRRGQLYGYKTNYGLHSQRSLIEPLKDVVDIVNREFVNPADLPFLVRRLNNIGVSMELLDCIASIEFCHNCVILRKAHEWEKNYSHRAYRSELNT